MGLYTKMIDLQKLNQAWDKVRKNKSAAGIDKMTVEDMDENRQNVLGQLNKELKEGKYKSFPAKIVCIHKGEKERNISILCMRDKIVHQSIANELTKIFDHSLSNHSYAYRPNYSALLAVKYLEDKITSDVEECKWVLTADIEKFFDNINREFLMGLLKRRIVENESLELIRKCIEIPCVDSQNEPVKKKKGICQGSALAPVLSNIYLDDFDKFVEKRFSTFVRYSDDLIIFAKEKEELEKFIAEANGFLGKRSLTFHSEKTKIQRLSEGVQFLGYAFNEKGKFIPEKATEKLSERLEIMWFNAKDSIQEKLKKGSEILLGWEQYYKDSFVQNIYEYVIICYQFQKRRSIPKEEFIEIRFAFENVHRDITKFMTEFWVGAGRRDMVLKEYEQYYQVLQLDDGKMNEKYKMYEEELTTLYEQLFIHTDIDIMNELLQIYSDMKCYNKARKIAELIRNEEQKNKKQIPSATFESVPMENVEDEKFSLSTSEIESYMELFVGRSDLYSVATINEAGRRTFDTIQLPILEENIKNHLKGKETIGTYIQRSNGSVKYMIFDIDISKKMLLEIHEDSIQLKQYLQQAKETAYQIWGELKKMGMAAYVEFSGYRGYHVWLFFEEWISTRYVNLLQDIVLNRLSDYNSKEITLECFPNKGRVKDKYFGQTIKLPWGLHYKTNCRTYFLDESGEKMENQTSMLEGVAKYTLLTLKRIISLYSSEQLDCENDVKKYDVSILGEISEVVRPIVEQCGLMSYLCMKAKQTGYLTHFERLTILYVFGHVGEEGKKFVHTIMEFTLNYQYSVTEKFIRKLPEKPISCNKLQEQYKQITSERGCNCRFVRTKNCYPSPVLHAIRDSQGNFQENECDITIPLVRQVSEAKKTKIYDELNVQKKIEEQAEKLIELKKQYRGVLKSVKKCEESLCRYFDDARIDSIELEMGILVREKTENGYEWKIEI